MLNIREVCLKGWSGGGIGATGPQARSVPGEGGSVPLRRINSLTFKLKGDGVGVRGYLWPRTEQVLSSR